MVDISTHNRAVYIGREMPREYLGKADLQAPESVILSRIRSEFMDKRILDIGVGDGRTTSHLLEISRHYIGIDYSPQMIAQCRARYPSVSFEVCDATDLSRLGMEAFDLIFFSFNGIDLSNHADRLKTLGEVRRALAKGGAFVFSSHNRDYAGVKSLLRIPGATLRTFLKASLFDPAAVLRHVLNKRHEEQNEEYAIINDNANRYQFLIYYISIEKQIEQLKNAGFKTVQAVGRDGRWIGEHEHSDCHRDPWIYYLCRCQ